MTMIYAAYTLVNERWTIKSIKSSEKTRTFALLRAGNVQRGAKKARGMTPRAKGV